MGNYKLYKVRFEANEYNQDFVFDFASQDLQELVRDFVEYCNVKHNCRVIIVCDRRSKNGKRR